MKRPFAPATPDQLRYSLNEIHRVAMEYIRAGKVLAIQISDPTRSLEQNAKLWALLHEVAKIDWYGQKLTPEEWKDVFSAALKQQKVVPGIEGGFVVCGQRTSQMSKAELSDLIEIIHAFGADPAHPVDFKDGVEMEPLGRTA